MTSETLESLLANVKYLADKVRALDWHDPKEYSILLDRVLYGNPSAKSCVEMALLASIGVGITPDIDLVKDAICKGYSTIQY